MIQIVKNNWDLDTPGIYRRSIFKIRPNILIGLKKLQLRPKDRSRSRLFIYLIFFKTIQLAHWSATVMTPLRNIVSWMLSKDL